MKIKLILGALLFMCSACNYLEILPPNVATIDDAFKNEAEAQKVLYSVYSFMPRSSDIRQNVDWFASDEFIHNGDNYWFPSVNIFSGENSSSQPTFNLWSHFETWRIKYPLYEGIRMGYLFLSRIDKVKGINPVSATKWKAEAKFLIAYYHYLLLRYYGPIVIVDKLIPLDASYDEMFQYRTPYDECVTWIANQLDEVIPNLPDKLNSSDYGKPTQTAAKAIKARMLLYAASPLFNGNAEYYSNFKDSKGVLLFSQEYDKNKWKKALDAATEAIAFAEVSGHQLYEHTPKVADNTQQAINNARYTMIDAWNKELIWGYTGWNEDNYQEDSYQCLASARTGEGGSPYEMMAPTLSMASMYYTKNGLPIDADPNYNYTNRFDSLVTINGEQVAYFNLDREPRYYACIGYDRGNYEINNTTIRLMMRYKEKHGKPVNPNDYSMSGFLVKKGIHPETVFESKDKRTLKKYPFPLVRLSELYLNYIEAYVEYYGRLDGQALIYLNHIRTKNGLPNWQDVKGLATRVISDEEVIRTERLVELAFEGHHFQDIRRWKLGEQYLNGTTQNLDVNQTTAKKFWRVVNTIEKYPRTFSTPKSYLQPICAEDIKINPNLIQNPGY